MRRSDERNRSAVVVPRKERVFTNYCSQRLQSDIVRTEDPEPQLRVNPVTGERVQSHSRGGMEQLSLASILPIPAIAGAQRPPPLLPRAIQPFLQQQATFPPRFLEQLSRVSLNQTNVSALPLFMNPLMANPPSLPSLGSPSATLSPASTAVMSPISSPICRPTGAFDMPSQFTQLPTQVQVETIASVLAADLHNRQLAAAQHQSPHFSALRRDELSDAESPPPAEPMDLSHKSTAGRASPVPQTPSFNFTQPTAEQMFSFDFSAQGQKR